METNNDDFVDYSGPFMTEFSVRQNGKIVHSIQEDQKAGHNRFTIRLAFANNFLGEQFRKVHIDLIPSNMRANPRKDNSPHAEGREAFLNRNGEASFIFDAEYDVTYSRESVQFFDVYVYLLTESLRDNSYRPELFFRTIIPRG